MFIGKNLSNAPLANPPALHGELIAFVGSDPYQGQWGNGTFFPQTTGKGYWGIGSSSSFISDRNGKLWLGINDDAVTKNTGDNSGSLTALINTVTTPAPTPPPTVHITANPDTHDINVSTNFTFTANPVGSWGNNISYSWSIAYDKCSTTAPEITGQTISQYLNVACGNATISVIAEDEKNNTANDTYLVTVHENVTPIPTPVSTFNISGFKINNATGSGVPNWNITLTNSTMQKSMLTGADGSYKFMNLANGTYSVTEETKTGWTSVSPISQQVTINGADMPNINFTNQPPSPTVTPVLTTITVSPSTAMLNVTETQPFTATALDQNNTPMSGINISWTISNSTVGSVTPLFAVTGMDGKASTTFTASAAGTTTVTATNGTVSGSSDVTVAAVTPQPIPSAGSISGYKIDDITGMGIPNWKIKLQLIIGNIITTRLPVAETTTNDQGFYKFDNLPAGSYILTEETKQGFVPVGSPVKNIQLAPGEDSKNNNFTNLNLLEKIAPTSNWQKLDVPLPLNADCQFDTMAINPKDPQKIYIGSSNGCGIEYYNGIWWTPMNNGIDMTLLKDKYVPITKIVISQSNPSILYVGSIDGYLYRSKDGANTWYDARGTSNWLGVHQINDKVLDITIDPKQPNIAYTGVAGGVYKTTDYGLNWKQVYKGESIDYYHIVRAGQSNSVYIAGGRVYGDIPCLPFKDISCTGTIPIDPYKSTNGGDSWTPMVIHLDRYVGLFDLDLHLLSDLSIDPTNQNTVYISTMATGFTLNEIYPIITPNGIFKSTDGGNTWKVINDGIDTSTTPIYNLKQDPSSPNKIFVATGFKGIYQSINGGSNWKPFAGPEGVPYIGNIYTSPGKLYALTSEGVFYISTNVG